MKLLTHNLLRCNAKGVKTGFPLRIEATKVELRETEMNEDFLSSMLSRLDWNALRGAAAQLKAAAAQPGVVQGEAVELPELPAEVNAELATNEDFLTALHTTLLEVVVVEGTLVCPESGRKFPITNAIPNMLLDEDEV